MRRFVRDDLGTRRPDRRWAWTPLLLALAALLMAWHTAPTLAERFDGARDCLRGWFGRAKLGGSYQGLAKALCRAKLHQVLAERLRSGTAACCGRFERRFGFRCFAADGTRIDVPRTAANRHAFGRGGRKKSGPQMTLTTLWHMGAGLPWCWRVGRSDAAERKHLKAMLKHLPPEALVVADAGFAGYDMLREMRRRGLHFLIRCGSGTTLLSGLAAATATPGRGPEAVWLWPGKRRRREPLALRLIELVRPGKRSAYLLSDLPASRLPRRAAARLYAMRWGVEVFYRSLKQKLQRRKMLSASPARARVELHWAVLGLWLVGLLAVDAAVRRGRDPLGGKGGGGAWSATLALRAVRAAVRGRAGLDAALAAACTDGYKRKGSKRARRGVHKKRDRPPRPPKIRGATPQEVRRAAEVYRQLMLN